MPGDPRGRTFGVEHVMTRVCTLVMLLGLSAAPVLAEGSKPDPKSIFERANQAVTDLKAMSYEAKIYGDGVMAERVPTITAKVIAERTPIAAMPKVRIEGERIPIGGSSPIKFKYANNGKEAFNIDDETKRFTSGNATSIKSAEMSALIPPKYLVDAPYRSEIGMQNMAYVGVEDVNGVECDVVKIVYDPSSGRAMTFWFGAKDSLLRKIENQMALRIPGKNEPETGRIVFETAKFDAQPKVDDKTFALVAPEGYESEKLVTPELAPDGLLAAGKPAPNWALKTPDGKNVTLKDLRGKIVLMDFWASWCGPCKMVMPHLQKLHEKFKDKPVVICGVNCRERGENGVQAAMDYVSQNKLTYMQLLNGDEAAKAYHVRGIPCMYLIGPDGNIIYATSGFQPSHEQMFTQFIEETLKSMAPAAGTKVSAK